MSLDVLKSAWGARHSGVEMSQPVESGEPNPAVSAMDQQQGRDRETQSFVRLASVSKSFGSVHAVRNVSLSVPEGEFFSLLGPSGCGKTTLLMMLAGLEELDSGSMFLDGRDVARQSVQERESAIVFQNYALFPHMTVEDNISFGLKMRHVRKEDRAGRVQDALDLVSLAGERHRYPSQLSGGQQQRVALARALVMRPKLLLLDEPLSNLDARLRRQLGLEIRGLQRRTGVTTIFVTHDLEEAFSLSDSLAVMRDGEVQQSGRPQDIYEHPSSEFVADFVGHRNVWTVVVEGPDGVGTRLRASPEVAFSLQSRVSGGQISVALPAHQVRFGREAGACDTHVDCVVRDREFIGGMIRLDCVTNSGFVVRAEAFADGRSPDDLVGILPGDQVTLGWDSAKVVVIGTEPE